MPLSRLESDVLKSIKNVAQSLSQAIEIRGIPLACKASDCSNPHPIEPIPLPDARSFEESLASLGLPKKRIQEVSVAYLKAATELRRRYQSKLEAHSRPESNPKLLESIRAAYVKLFNKQIKQLRDESVSLYSARISIGREAVPIPGPEPEPEPEPEPVPETVAAAPVPYQKENRKPQGPPFNSVRRSIYLSADIDTSVGICTFFGAIF